MTEYEVNLRISYIYTIRVEAPDPGTAIRKVEEMKTNTITSFGECLDVFIDVDQEAEEVEDG